MKNPFRPSANNGTLEKPRYGVMALLLIALILAVQLMVYVYHTRPRPIEVPTCDRAKDAAEETSAQAKAVFQALLETQQLQLQISGENAEKIEQNRKMINLGAAQAKQVAASAAQVNRNLQDIKLRTEAIFQSAPAARSIYERLRPRSWISPSAGPPGARPGR